MLTVVSIILAVVVTLVAKKISGNKKFTNSNKNSSSSKNGSGNVLVIIRTVRLFD